MKPSVCSKVVHLYLRFIQHGCQYLDNVESTVDARTEEGNVGGIIVDM